MTRTRRSRFALGATVLAAALTLAGCASSAGDDPADGTTGTATTGPELTGDLTVYAAASLTAVFEELGDRFEAANPGVEIAFSFGGSSGLVTQLQEGAIAGVFASADEANMGKLVDAGLVETEAPRIFATNVLEIATPPDNPAGIAAFADLAAPGARVVVCAEQVPCGAATAKVETATGVALSPVSEEQSVTDVLAKVASGDADAGLVYATDVQGAGGSVLGVPFDESAEAVNRYPIAALADAPDADLAAAWVAFVLGPDGQEALAAAGFGAP
ncbi:molybdate ABC transporter substrate-binding protein [Agromyces seonyuensis]|uniref:Molybdate ABC transporter substrate-binding protein n=1 Tax=Agromyces seonyuensis TaxID=2662446 RepID=A0A6I4NTT7_9MICO|nr:molybdate ABC transporter substrate-binding protein [Agromyces seonyuensis]MWB97521.1 molybdate ABC transporter substrate-binding protein [Agromyces seonyuensis]